MSPFKGLFKKKGVGAVQKCPLTEWQLEVTVTRTASPPTFIGGATVNLDDGGLIDTGPATIGAATSGKADFTGDQPQNLTVSAVPDDDRWYAVATTTVAVVLGLKKTAALQLKAKPWIKFKVVEDETKNQLGGLTLTFTLPSGQQALPTASNATIDALKLDPTDNTCSIDEIDNGVDATIWEVIKVESA